MKKIAITIVVLLLVALTRWLEHNNNVVTQVVAEPQRSNKEQILLTESQSKFVKVKPVIDYDFQANKEAVGSIAFNDLKTIQVFPNYAGKIHRIFVKLGDTVKVGQPLYAIDSPDLLQAESTLIASAATKELSSKALVRAQALFKLKAMAEKDYQQAISDQQTAEGAYQSAINNLKIFGKTDTEIQLMIKNKKADPELIVRSPINGQVITFNNPAPGAYVQPGTPPAPMAVSDITSKWMIANVAESDISTIKLGQSVDVKVPSLKDLHFKGVVSSIGAQVDINTHSVLVRSDISDESNSLIPGMLSYFTITTGNLKGFPAVPFESVVRQGDGTLTVWVTGNGRLFEKRQVTIGLQQGGNYQILSGLHSGEMVATQGAVFVSHAYDMSTE
ncbi:efflux RND transporter periplasmic adaptor subunit [Ferrovum sp. PN-J185]|uniref:efflux RND transporter periplasmic adaptor subunit n=1 Tax=Ferrovum sp. PN-J185 TaxID=1356306 RepID=UPI000791550A|nr:efflux RND transporter periplasmic adaptor subunit [Ferrovum sp. PN-J185]KXW55965.1 cobalt-zinc-cadmium resistance protein CzcB [Ferrovum sp. PN-J185]MCC6068323.1 efflux RND transporter periplasmic adaptor subunit [Ferrovum sp. PN-J185]MDE1891950.1 efflux RND transporter periplasmic adaptor subunit [Betaproteobacteria bacterium]MDE2056944.1 efflux RND transporter periplasmic adaptor subunit [Betaproteobacteria bacterium]